MDITIYDAKKIIVTDIDDQTFSGMGKYLPSGDNDDQGELLLVRDDEGWVTQFNPDEIKSVEIIK